MGHSNKKFQGRAGSLRPTSQRFRRGSPYRAAPVLPNRRAGMVYGCCVQELCFLIRQEEEQVRGREVIKVLSPSLSFSHLSLVSLHVSVLSLLL